MLDGIKSHRGLAIRPQRTGPVIDVLYSAAGNSADEAYYTLGIIGYDFEIGDTTTTSTRRRASRRPAAPAQQPPFGDSTNDCLDNEGFHEAMEFSAGNYGLMQSALDYANDTTPPVVTATGRDFANVTQDVRFTSNEAVLDLLHDRRLDPDDGLHRVEAEPRPRAAAADLDRQTSTLKWIAHDFRGNLSARGLQDDHDRDRQPTVTLNGFTEGQVFTQQRPVPITFTCVDEAGGSGIATCVGSTSNGMLDTSTPGTFTYKVTGTDNAGNVTVLERTYTVLTATNTNGSVSGTVPATLALTLGPADPARRVHPGRDPTYTASTTANVISSAGDAALSWSRPEHHQHRQLVNGAFALPQPFTRRSRLVEVLVDRSGLQRLRDDLDFTAVNSKDAAPHGHVLQGADLHAVDDDPVNAVAASGPVGCASPDRPVISLLRLRLSGRSPSRGSIDSRGLAMRPWMGAVAVAAAMLVAPSVAFAGEDDPAFMQFKLASSADYDDFERLGLNMGHNVINGGGDSIIVNAWVTDESSRMVRAHGYEAVGVLDDKFNIDRIRAERNETLAKIKAANDALHGKGVKAKGKSAVGDIHAQSAWYYENLGGRWLAIEANADGAQLHGHRAPTPTSARP